jgi:hypothetical protein
LRAATANADRTVVVSHATAAAVHGFGLRGMDERAPIEVTTTYSALVELRGVVVHRTRRLEPRDVTSVNGVPATTPERTIVDCAARLDVANRYELVDKAVCARRTGRGRLHRRALELQHGRRGVASIVAITSEEAPGEFRSYLERRAGQVIRRGGLPAPRWNVPVRRGGKLLGVVDALWQEAALVAEFDGLRFHLPPARRAKDVARDRRLLLEAGLTVMRFTYVDVIERPDEMLAQLGQALGAVPRHRVG